VRLYLSAVVLTLAWFSAINAAASLLIWLTSRFANGRSTARAGCQTAQLFFALRMLPLAASIVFAFGLFLPVHWIYEAREGSESFGALLYGLALLGVALISGSAVRTFTALRACRRLRLTWSGQVENVERIVDDTAMPGMWLAGVVRTTIVVGRPVREVLTHEELEVALAHEIAHRQSWDNLKRFAMFASPDFFRYTRAARQLEQQWSAEVECVADAWAVAGNASRAADLASALIKVARLAGAATRVPAVPIWSTFYERALLELRVRRLVDGTVAPARVSPLLPAGLLMLVTLTLTGAWVADLPRTVHVMTEALVRFLP
jgi:hypothetical protein